MHQEGFKPTKYGLIIPSKKKNKGGFLKKNALGKGKGKGKGKKKTALVRKPLNVFGAGDSDSEDEDTSVNAQLKRAEKARMRKHERAKKEALAQDATVFDYDGVFDDMQSKRQEKKDHVEAQKLDRKSRYIGTLMKKAEFREKEQELIRERMLLRERKKEDHEHEGKEKFVTSAYKAKLMEDQRWKRELEMKDKRDLENDVTKKGDTSSFMKNLMSGGQGSRYNIVDIQEQEREKKRKERKEREESEREKREKEEREKERQRQREREHREEKEHRDRDRDRDRRKDEGRSRTHKRHSGDDDKERSRKRQRSAADDNGKDQTRDMHQSTHTSNASKGVGISGDGATTEDSVKRNQLLVQAKKEGKIQAKIQVESLGRRNDSKAVMSARERYLARKKAAAAAKR